MHAIAESNPSRGLRAAFPLPAAAQPESYRGYARRIAVEHGRNRQRQRPQWREAVTAHGNQESSCHQGDGCVDQDPGFAGIREKENSGEQIGHKETDERGDQQSR